MANIYRKTFVDPYPNGWKNKPDETTPIDAEALNPITKALSAIDNWLDGVNKDKIGSVKKVHCTLAQYNEMPSTKYSDGVMYFISDGGAGNSYSNYEQEEF